MTSMTSINNLAEIYYNTDCQDFITHLVSKEILLEIEYESSAVNQSPQLCIKYNNIIVNDTISKEGINYLKINLTPNGGQQILEISMIGKNSGDTLVEDGVIIKDTFIKLLDLKINNYKLLDDYDFFYNKFEYLTHKNNTKLMPSTGFWEDATLKIVFDLPFDLWYNKTSTKNSGISESLQFRSTSDLDTLIRELEESLKKLI